MSVRKMTCLCPPFIHFRSCWVQYNFGWVEGNHNVRDIIEDHLDYVNEQNMPNNIESVLDKVNEYVAEVYAAHGMEYKEYEAEYVYE